MIVGGTTSMGERCTWGSLRSCPGPSKKSKRCQPAPPVDNVPFRKERLERQVFQALFIQPTSRTKRQAKRTWASCLRDRQLQMKPAPNGKSRVTSHSATHGSHAKWNTTGDPLQFTYCNFWFGSAPRARTTPARSKVTPALNPRQSAVKASRANAPASLRS